MSDKPALSDESALNEIRNDLRRALPKVMNDRVVAAVTNTIMAMIHEYIKANPKKTVCELCGSERPLFQKTMTDPRNNSKVMICKDCISKYFSLSLFEKKEA